MTMMNNTVVEFKAGQLAESFTMDDHDKSISFKETCNIKWGAIGIIENRYSGIPQSFLIRYRVKIIWNNNKLVKKYIGANEINLRRLSEEDKLQWMDFINDKENEKDGNV